MKKYTFLFLFHLLLAGSAAGQYRLNENCRNAWMLLMDLKIGEAKGLVKKELSIHPDNYYALYLGQTCDAYALFINSGEEDYEAFIDAYEEKREIMEGKFEDSPYYLMCKSEMDIQAGMFKIMNGSVFSGIGKAYSGYKAVYKNIDKHPDFMPGFMLDGFLNVAMSNLPPFVKSAASVLGISSDFDYGIRTLDDVYQSQRNSRGLNAASALFIIFAAKINKTPEMVFDFTQTYDPRIRDLFLLKYFKANIEYRTGRNERALATLSDLSYENSPYAELLYNYMMGKALMRKLDNRAAFYIDRFLKQMQRKEYIKEMTYLRALYDLINGDRERYGELCKTVKKKGSDINERDREALYDASLDYEPDVKLVKARLLLDGGYMERFEQTMAAYEHHPRAGLPYQLEYLFLKGRYAHESGDDLQAISFFNRVVDQGREQDYYFASEAALRLGEIYEAEDDYSSAKKYYKLSADLYKNKYYEYIGDKANKGLNRIKTLAKK